MSVGAGEDRQRRERDLYRALLALPAEDDPAKLLSRVLSLLRETAQAKVGYVELQDDTTGNQRGWSEHYGLDETALEKVQDRVSRGVIGEARATGQTIHIPSAMVDDRFAGRESVRRAAIEAVLCVPLIGDGISGVFYLQDHLGGGPFPESDVENVEAVATFVASQARRMLELLQRRRSADATAAVRRTLAADEVLGRSPAMARLLERLQVVAAMEDNVLLTGPSGSGKSTLARVLHNNSRRSDGPFVEINAPTIGRDRLEAELFGAVPGAYTGAPAKGLPGKVAAAQGGTLMLDEIGELQPEVQAKLLRFLETKDYYPVGGAKPLSADVRIVAATNRDLESAIRTGDFREDLYHRLRGMELRVPALETRREDIPLLATHFCERICAANALPPMGLSPTALAELEFAPWPGNIRELINRCRDAVVSAKVNRVTTIELKHLFAEEGGDDGESRAFRTSREQWERSFLASALREHDWNVSVTAKELELSRSYLNAKIKKYGLTRARE